MTGGVNEGRGEPPSRVPGVATSGTSPLASTLSGFAYLRALAEGLEPQVAAERYLGATGAVEIRRAHRLVVEQARAAARRHRDPGWRLLGVELEQARYRPPGSTRESFPRRSHVRRWRTGPTKRASMDGPRRS